LRERFSQSGDHGREYDLIKSAISLNIDRQVLVDSIGGEFTVRLAREIERGAALAMDLRYTGMEVAGDRPKRFLSFTIQREDAAAIYKWNVERAGLPSERVPTAESLSRWDWGQWLDSILRTGNRADGQGSSAYWRIFREMWQDGFIVKAVILALRNPKIFRQEFGLKDCTMH
jgi:hypothetical protein